MYKLPKGISHVPQVMEGYGQMYMDVNNPSLQLSDVSLQDTNHAIAHTLQQVYSNADSQVKRGWGQGWGCESDLSGNSLEVLGCKEVWILSSVQAEVGGLQCIEKLG